MGCDIHLVLEKHDDERDRWVGIRDYRLFDTCLLARPQKAESPYVVFKIKERNYDFFNDLCGVRGEGSQFGYEPKGLPDDASDLSLFALSDGGDLHSHSWLAMEELEPVLQAHWPELTTASVAAALEGRNPYKLVTLLVDDYISNEDDWAHPRKYRLVFAFDN